MRDEFADCRRDIQTIINNRVVPCATTFEFEGWSIPAAGPHEIALALKSARTRPSNDIRTVVSTLSSIGRRGTWINDADLSFISRRVGSALSYLQHSIFRFNSWLAGLEETMLWHGVPIVEGYCTERGLWRGGVTTTMVLAGDATAVGPLALAHSMLAGARVIAKGSRYEPLAPCLFIQELIRCGLETPNLIFVDTAQAEALETMAPLFRHTRQSVVYGSDSTIDRIYRSAEISVAHKKIGFWSGRSGVVVLDDADPDLTAQVILTGTAEDRGNRCYSTMKAFVPKSMMPALLPRLLDRADALRVGEPDHAETDIGRLEADGRRLTMVSIGTSRVLYDRQVMFVEARDDDALMREEMAYPVCAIRPYEADEDPVELSNRSTSNSLGDGALCIALVTADRDRFLTTASKLQAMKVVHNRPTVDIDHIATHQGIFLFKEMMRFTEIY